MLMLITILSLPCLANTNKLLRSLTDLGYVPKDKIKVVLNRYIKKSEISLNDARPESAGSFSGWCPMTMTRPCRPSTAASPC